MSNQDIANIFMPKAIMKAQNTLGLEMIFDYFNLLTYVITYIFMYISIYP